MKELVKSFLIAIGVCLFVGLFVVSIMTFPVITASVTIFCMVWSAVWMLISTNYPYK